jgi:uncharacterized coiled-coil protein SlyX
MSKSKTEKYRDKVDLLVKQMGSLQKQVNKASEGGYRNHIEANNRLTVLESRRWWQIWK